MDEDWFIMIHIGIEHEAKEILNNLKTYYLDKNEDQSYLENALVSIKKINQIMNRMPEKCDPFIYYNRVRPYIFGWKNISRHTSDFSQKTRVKAEISLKIIILL